VDQRQGLPNRNSNSKSGTTNSTQSRQDAKFLTFFAKIDRETAWRNENAQFSKKSLRLCALALSFWQRCPQLNFGFGIAGSESHHS
jgi:hypothetical protein